MTKANNGTDKRTNKRADKRNWSLRGLVAFALQDWESDASWQAICELQGRGSPDTLAMAQGLVRSRNWRKRTLGLYIVSQLRLHDRRRLFDSIEYGIAETHALLLGGLDDPRPEVVRAALSGFGHRPLPPVLPRLIALAGDADSGTRWQVAYALGYYEGDEAIQALMTLAHDPSDDVRDWATFGIGTMHKSDSPAIRELLWANLHDHNENVRGEALMGLAERKDERIIPVLLDSLSDRSRVYELDAAHLMADSSLLEKLEVLEQAVDVDEDLDPYWHNCLIRAIEACRRPQAA